MTLNLAWLEDFLTLAESGNFSRAADERHITQPAFSRRIRALEEWLGADLFDRSGQPARLTETGHWFRKTALELQARVASLPGEAISVAQASAASLSFAATHALSFTFVPRWLRSLEPRSAFGPVRLVSDVQPRCEAMLLQGQVQFLVTHAHPAVPGPLDEAGCPSVVIGRDRLLPVSAPDGGGRPMHRLEAPAARASNAGTRTGTGTRTSSSAGAGAGVGVGVAMLGYSEESGLGRILAQLRGRAVAPTAHRPVMTAHLASVLRTMVLDGQGLAWLPGVLVDDDLAAGRLVIAAADEAIVDLQIRLYREPAALAAPAEALWLTASGPAPGERSGPA